MHLEHIRVRNFRNLKDLSVRLQPGLNVLVGRNNTGKTNLFSAIRHALGPAAARGDSLWLIEDDIYRGRDRTRSSDPIRIDLAFADLSENQLAQFFEILDLDPTDIPNARARVHFEATWSDAKRRFSVRRWGGREDGPRTEVPTEILASLPITFLPALRDAEEALTPGNRSRLARLFEDIAGRWKEDPAPSIERIFQSANDELERHDLVCGIRTKLQTSARGMAGSDYAECSIRPATPEFRRVLRTLRVLVNENPIPDLDANGLGYNNLLYIATVLTHLAETSSDECPILLVEEPEAHLHPQLTVRLGEFLSGQLPGSACPQTIVSTHSPTFASHVSPSKVSVLFAAGEDSEAQCNALRKAALTAPEERALQRMLDVTRSTLYFSKGLILVEGISEALLVPELARWLGYDLSRDHVSVIPICGVSFGVFSKILGPDVFGIPVSIVTDGDPPVANAEAPWREHDPKGDDGSFAVSARARRLQELFEGHPTVAVFTSEVTLEYDMAAAGPRNPAVMAKVWEDASSGHPRTLNSKMVEQCTDDRERVLSVWRGICRADHTGSKAEFAHCLAEWVSAHVALPREERLDQFKVPVYLHRAIRHAGAKLS